MSRRWLLFGGKCHKQNNRIGSFSSYFQTEPPLKGLKYFMRGPEFSKETTLMPMEWRTKAPCLSVSSLMSWPLSLLLLLLLPQSCPTLCDPIDGSPPGSPVPGILQARTLERVAISFSNAWKWSHSVMPNSSQPYGLQPTRLLHPWDFPGKSTGVGCLCLLPDSYLAALKKKS